MAQAPVIVPRDETHQGFIDMSKNEVRNLRLQNLASDIAGPVDGLIYYKSDTDKVRAYINGVWTDLATMADVTAGGISVAIIDAKGDLIVGSAADTAIREAVGANGTVYVANSANAGGHEWRVLTEADINLAATDRLVGRDTAGAGVAEELTVGGGIEFTGAGGVQTSAFTGDVTKTAGGTALAIAAGVIDNADINAAAGIAVTKLAVSATDRLLGRDTAAAGAVEELTVSGGVEFTGSGGIQTSAFTGAVTKAAGGTATTLANDAVSNVHVAAGAAIAGTKIAFTPAQNIAATNMQAAVEEVVTDMTALISSVSEGKAWKDPVRAASTGNLTLTAPGATIDGVTMTAGDRFLAKDQTSHQQDGIYTWNGAASTATRATDMNVNTEANNATVLVEEGTTNKGDVYTQTATIATLDTTPMVWTKSGEGNTVYTADEVSLTLTGTVFSVKNAGVDLTTKVTGALPAANGGTGQAGGYAIGDLLYASGASALSKLADIAAGNVLLSGGVATAPAYGKVGLTTHVTGTLPLANGGTNATTAVGAAQALGAARYASGSLTGGSNSEVITHNLNTRLVSLIIRNNASPFEQIETPYNEATSVNTMTVYAGAGNNLPASYTWLVTGIAA